MYKDSFLVFFFYHIFIILYLIFYHFSSCHFFRPLKYFFYISYKFCFLFTYLMVPCTIIFNLSTIIFIFALPLIIFFIFWTFYKYCELYNKFNEFLLK